MTLLEALVALVVLGLSAIGYLDVFHGAVRGARTTAEWLDVAARAEAAMEPAIAARERGVAPPPPSPDVHVEVRPWRDRVEDVVATVRLSDGRSLEVHRLVRTR